MRIIASKPNEDNHVELLIPWFPAPVRNVFLSTHSFAIRPQGIISEAPNIDLDAILEALHKQYPGIPREIHEKYILRSCYAAAQFPVGTEVRPVITADSAMVQDLEGSKHIDLW